MNVDETQPINENQASVQPVAPIESKPHKKPKKGLIIGIVSGSVVLVGAIAAVLIYSFAYNNPDNAVMDAFSKVLAAKSGSSEGTLSIKSPELSAKADIKSVVNESGKASSDVSLTATVAGKDYNLKGHFAGTKDELYIKIDDIRSLIKDGLGAEYASMIDTYYGTLLDKIDSKWVVIKQSDIDSYTNSSNNESQCVENQISKIGSDANLRNELMDVYRKNPLFTVASKGSDKDGNHYVLTPVSSEKAREFLLALADTKLVKSVDDCVSSDLKTALIDGAKDITSSSDKATGSLELWIDGWSHNINKVALSSKNDSSEFKIELNTKFNNNPSVTIPKGETTFDDLKSEIEKIQSQFQPQYETTYDYDESDYDYDSSLYY